jgi:hypothetical protein
VEAALPAGPEPGAGALSRLRLLHDLPAQVAGAHRLSRTRGENVLMATICFIFNLFSAQTYKSQCLPVVKKVPGFLIFIRMDPYCFWKLDPDPQLSEKLDPNPKNRELSRLKMAVEGRVC